MSLYNIGIILFVCIIEVFLLFDYFNNFFEIKVRKENVKYIFGVTCILLFCINMIGNANVNLFLFPMLMWIFVSLVFECKTGVRLGYFISAYVVMIGVEFLYLILSHTTSMMVAAAGVVPVSDYGWQMVFIKFLNFVVFLILKQSSAKSRNRMINKLFLGYLCVPIFTLCMMITIFYSGVDIKENPAIRIFMTVFFTGMLLSNMVLFYSFQKYTENLSETMQQKVELVYKNVEIERLSKITEMNETYNEAVHNMSHSLKVIDQLAEENNIKDIRQVIEQLTGRLSKKQIIQYSNNKMLNTLLSEYSVQAEKKGILFDVYVEPRCVIKQIKDIDLVSMLGNLFDNAIEASLNIRGASIFTRIFMHKNGKMCIIKIVNDFMTERLMIVNGKAVSTKNEEGIHGIGLTSISKTIEKYNGSFSYYIENEKFIAVLIIPI